MHSFTSSSDTRAPNAPYARQWLMTLLLVVIVAVASELGYRGMGHSPSVTDSMALWAHERAQVYPRDGKQSIVLLGSSRMQLGVVPEVLEQKLPGYTVIQLAIDGTSGQAVLKDLASDPQFSGLVIYDASVFTLSESGISDQQAWVDFYYQEWGPLKRLNTQANLYIQLFLQERLVISSSVVGLNQLLRHEFRVPPSYIVTQPNRYRAAYYHDILTPEELARLRERRMESARADVKPATEQSLAAFTTTLQDFFKPLVAQIQQRGGNVLFLHLPLNPERMALYEISFPRSQFWDQITPVVGAPTLHFEDVPGMRELPVPDASHLDVRDARIFTEILADELVRLKLVDVAD